MRRGSPPPGIPEIFIPGLLLGTPLQQRQRQRDPQFPDVFGSPGTVFALLGVYSPYLIYQGLDGGADLQVGSPFGLGDL